MSQELIVVHQLKPGDRFRLPIEYGDHGEFIYEHMDGMYCFARSATTGAVLNWAGEVVLVKPE